MARAKECSKNNPSTRKARQVKVLTQMDRSCGSSLPGRFFSTPDTNPFSTPWDTGTSVFTYHCIWIYLPRVAPSQCQRGAGVDLVIRPLRTRIMYRVRPKRTVSPARRMGRCSSRLAWRVRCFSSIAAPSSFQSEVF
jgi:hypothetical protein